MQFVPRRILHALFRPSLWPWCVGFIVGIDLPFPGEKQIRGIWLFLLEVIFPRENNRGRVVDLRSKAKKTRFRGRTTGFCCRLRSKAKKTRFREKSNYGVRYLAVSARGPWFPRERNWVCCLRSKGSSEGKRASLLFPVEALLLVTLGFYFYRFILSRLYTSIRIIRYFPNIPKLQ